MNTARKVYEADASLRGSVRGRDKIFGAINFWVLFNREFSVRINRIGARAQPSCPALSATHSGCILSVLALALHVLPVLV